MASISNGTPKITDIKNLFHNAFIAFSFLTLSSSILLSSSRALYPALPIVFFISIMLINEDSKEIVNFSAMVKMLFQN
ncbi:MAG: hypothetical protein ACJAX4_002815 [Clostridium sp.]|jgi:hypothetical protein